MQIEVVPYLRTHHIQVLINRISSSTISPPRAMVTISMIESGPDTVMMTLAVSLKTPSLATTVILNQLPSMVKI